MNLFFPQATDRRPQIDLGVLSSVSGIRFFIVGSALIHLVFFSLFVFVVPCTEGKSKPQLNFLGAILSRHDLFSQRSDSSYVSQRKEAFTYESPALFQKWQENRGVEKPGFTNEREALTKPSYKEVSNRSNSRHAPKKHATLEEIGVSLDAPPPVHLGIKK